MGKLVDKSKHETFVAKSSLHSLNSRPKAVLVLTLLNLEVYGFKINTKAHLDQSFYLKLSPMVTAKCVYRLGKPDRSPGSTKKV